MFSLMGMGDGWTDRESMVAASCTSALGYNSAAVQVEGGVAHWMNRMKSS